MAGACDKLIGRWMYYMEGPFNATATLRVGIFDFGKGIAGALDFGALGPSPLKEGGVVSGVLQVITGCSQSPDAAVAAGKKDPNDPNAVRLDFRNQGFLFLDFSPPVERSPWPDCTSRAKIVGGHQSLNAMKGWIVRIA